jgi:hypothetical protein
VNLFLNVVLRHRARKRIGALLLFLSLFAAAGAESASAKRFLFIIDTSAGMKPLEMPLRETLFDLIYSGARGHMTNGDTYGVWLVSDRNDTSFPMEVWKHKFVVEIAAKAVSHMKDHGFKGKSHLELAVADANRIVQNVEDLTVILVSNGETPLVGTPFDEQINARFAELAPAMKTAKATLNTVLIAQDGKFVAWTVNSPEFLIDVPRVAPKPKRARTEHGIAKTSSPDTNANVAAAVAAPKARIAPIIITKESVAAARRDYLSSSSTSNPPDAPTVATNVTNAILVADATVASPTLTTTNVAIVAETNKTNAITVKAEPVVPFTNVARVVATAIAETIVTNPFPAHSHPAGASGVAMTPVSNVGQPSGTNLILVCAGAGAGGAILVVLCAMYLARFRRQEPSLISQAIARERLSVR